MPPADDTDRKTSDWWLAGYRAASEVAAKGAMFVVTVVAARRLSHDEFGLFAVATTLGWLGAVVADFGLQLHVARAVAQQQGHESRILERWLPVRVGSASVALALSIALLRAARIPPAQMLPAVVFTTTYAVTGLSEFLYYVFRGVGRSDIESTLTIAQRAAMCALAVAALAWQPRAFTLAVAMLIPAVATAIVALVRVRTLVRWHAVDGPFPPGGLPSDGTAAEFLTSVAPLGAGIVLSALYFRIDVFLLERWRDAETVALYSAVFRIVDALRLLPAAIIAVVLPRLCRATDYRLLVRLALATTAAAAPLSLVLGLTADKTVPLLYGAGYAAAAAPFKPLLLAFPLMTLNFALAHQLVAWHGQRAYAAMCAGALALNVGLNAWLIPLQGASGAAWTTVWTEVFLTAACAVALVRTAPGTTEPAGAPQSVVVA